MLAFLERNQNFSVKRADRRAISEREIKRFSRPPDIVEDQLDLRAWNDLAKLFFDPTKDDLGAFQTQSRRRAHVQPKLPGIHLWKEIAADERNKDKRRCQGQPGNQKRRFAAIEKALEQTRVARPDRDVSIVKPGVQP